MYAALDLLLSIAVIESCMMVVAALVPNFMMGVIVGAGLIVSPLFFLLNALKHCISMF